jgi:hypothetical protein
VSVTQKHKTSRFHTHPKTIPRVIVYNAPNLLNTSKELIIHATHYP